MADIYKIAVGISLSSNAPGVLGEMSRLLTGVDGQVSSLIKKWENLGTSMQSTIKGLVQISSGVMIADGLAKVTEAGGELVKFQGQLQNLGKSLADIQVDTNAAIGAQIAVHGTNVAGNLKVLRELSGVTATSDDARAILPDVLKNAVVVSNLIGGSPEDYVQTLVKTAELRGDGVDPKTGKLSPERLIEGVRQEVASIVGGGGLIKPSDMLGMVQQAGPMARMYTDAAAFWQSMQSAMMDMGGRRAGTAETALGRQLFGEKMSLSTAMDMEEYGLYPKGSVHKSGTGVQIDSPLLGEAILKGPGGLQAWFEGVLLPQMVEHGATTQDAQQQALYKLFGTETSRRLAGLFLTSQAQVEKDAALQRAAGKQDMYGNVMGTDLSMNMRGLSDAWKGLLEVAGTPMVKPAIAALTSLTNGINQFVGVLAAHPELTKIGGEVAGLGSLALLGIGTKNLAMGLFGKGGLSGSAIALNTSATMLQEAAVALGAKGGVPGSPGSGGSGGLSWAKMGFSIANAAYAAWAMPSDMKGIKEQWLAADQTNKGLGEWYKANAPSWLQSILPMNGNGTVGGSVKLYDPKGLHDALDKMHWNGGKGVTPPAPQVTVAPPQVKTDVKVQIGNSELKAFITNVVNEVIGNAATIMANRPPAANTGVMAPAIDGTAGGWNGGW